MRYIARWGNGYWKVFDREHYTDVMVCALRREALEAAASRNAKRRRP